MSYATEAILWGAWIKQNLADQLPVTVAGLVMDNDFGLAYEDGIRPTPRRTLTLSPSSSPFVTIRLLRRSPTR